MKCIGYILRIQTVDNTYTIHRLIIACASHTNDNDLWNRLSKSISKQTITEAWNNLTIIREKTPWSISSDGSIIPATEPNSLSGDRNNHRINRVMVPGSFSDHIIQIIEKELRPCFTHVKAQKLVDRAKTTITLHQDKIRKESGRMVEDISNNSVIPSSKNGNGYITAGENRELLIPHSQQRSRQPIAANQNRILIAPVTDTPNDEEENWAAMDTGEDEGPSITCVSGSSGLPSQSRRWDKTFLGSVPVVEWCAQQPIQDMNRIHEVFMLLVGPILAMTDSLQYQYRIRGLDMLTRFLIQYHDQDYHQKQPSTAAKAKTGTPQMDSKIWIKIFTRTGLDQVLERSLKPLLVPIQAGLTLTPQQQQQDSLLPIGDSEELEAISAAFRAYLTLILVNTEPAYKPVSVTDDSYTVSLKESNKGGLTVENLFVHAVLASFRRANPSREYKTVVLRWATVLIQPIISFDFIREELVSKDGYSRQRNDQKKHKTQNQQRTNPEKGSFSLEVSNSDIPQQSFQGIYGMGIITIKYLPTLIPYICGILDLYFPSSPPEERIKSLDLAWISSKALYMIMLVSKSRIPRYRGKILAALASCWANSRTYSDALSSESLKDAQARLDQSLVDAMGLIKQICQPKIAEDAQNGLEIDLKVLQNLDPPVFNPLFVPQ
ncbi:hypothetical protein BCR41DRAFT_375002 [Lobosporangium transversale]|uniref:Uncharacterized protein n=1 Tax=Lobosporangium transversale TaxID=64571 RepID=A0A1Y2G8C1_9FUNG|nr:hypothetical protein BCR41DRAFT_375002 [Lobosporangium transversale]ORZ04179.1 hypothetical protein BCR41DRAFT_375002 [Lobosporangium transversale]|eukprot:XP_021876393.1 hypothetical protein BCR41DRAFT_375002 [Lobosporangium transversale]